MSTPISLKVVEVRKETAEAVSIWFECPRVEDFTFQSGQFLTLLVESKGTKHRRPYSLCSAPNELPRLGVAVKKVSEGLISGILVDQLKVGDQIEVLPPQGNFKFEPDQSLKRHIVLFGAGSGITPLFSILKTVLTEEPNSIVSLVYANRDAQSIIFNEDLCALEKEYSDRLKIVHILEHGNDSVIYKGLLTNTLAIHILGTLQKAGYSSAEYFLCGPNGFMEVVKSALQDTGVKTGNIHRESFKPAQQEVKEQDASLPEFFEVKVIMSGETFVFPVKKTETILEAAYERNIDLPSSCQSGICTACRGKCLSGKVVLDEREGLSDSEMAAGFVLTCVGHPVTEGVVIEIG